MTDNKPKPRDALDLLKVIISMIDSKQIKKELDVFYKCREQTMLFTAPEIRNYKNTETIRELSQILPFLEIDPIQKEKIKNIFSGEDTSVKIKDFV